MIGFQYYTPTRVVFGKETENQVGQLIKAAGGTKILLHYGSGSVKKTGLLDRITASLQAEGLAFVELGGVVPNPRLSLVRQGIELCQKEGVDFLLAVGGGSVIDSAKAIGYGVRGGAPDVWDYFTGKAVPTGCLPLGCVLTLAAAGSEMSDSCVITKDETWEKRGYANDHSRAKFAVMNPELTLTLPDYQTAAGCADIVMHTLERYFTGVRPTMEITDSIAEGLMRTVMQNARILTRDPQNYAARAEVMWAGSLSHNGLTQCGATRGDWSTHQLGHELSGKYDLAHGASLTAVWGSWARYVYKEDAARFAKLAINVLDIPDEGSEEEIALAGIEEMEGFFWAIEMPTSLEEAELEVSDADIKQMAEGFSRGGSRTVGEIKALSTADAEAIYTMARHSQG